MIKMEDLEINGFAHVLKNQWYLGKQTRVRETMIQNSFEGRKSAEFEKEGLTYDFLDNLEDEGITHELVGDKVILNWEGALL